MATTKVTSQTYTATGTQSTKYSFTFPYSRQTDVQVRVNDVVQATTTYTFPTATEIQFVTGSVPTSGKSVEIYRNTNVDNPEARFGTGSSIRAQDLNSNIEQLLFDSQEWTRAEDIASYAVTLPKINPGTENQILTTVISGGKTASSWSDNIDINGTLDVTGATDLDSTLTVDGAVDLNTTLNVDGNTTLVGALDVDGNTTLDGTTIDGILDVNGSATIDNVQINGNEIDTTSGGLTLDSTSGTVTVDDNLTVVGNLNVGGGSVPQLTTARTIAQSGDVVWSVSFDGSADVTAAATIQNDAITSAKIASNAVETDEIKNDAVTVIKIADAELKTLAGMQTGTAGILAGGTALAATLPEINSICENRASQTTITDDDLKIPTSGAVVDYVTAVVSPIGGLEVIANEDSFPTTQPASGIVISIADAEGVVISGAGQSTNCRKSGSGSDDVTINNFPSSLHSETIAPGVGLMVTSTGSSDIYNYHKLLAAENDVKRLSDDINDFNERYRVGANNPSSSLHDGDLFFNTTDGEMKVYDATQSQWEVVTAVGAFYINTISSSSGSPGTGGSSSFDGNANRFTLSNAGNNAQQHLVSINGVVQKPNSGTSVPSEGFAIDGDDILLSSAPATGSDYFIVTIGAAVNIGTPSNNTVTTTHIVNGTILNANISASAAIVGSKLADDSIAEVKLDIHNAPSGTDKYLKYTSNGMEWATVAQYTTPLTTEGDILYRDGSGDQRLAKGTAGQVLKMNSGATAPEWSADLTATALTQEQVEDFVGDMVTGNTETGITVTYEDSDGTLDFVVASQTDNNFTNTLKTKLDGIADSAEVNVQSDWNASSGDALILNKPTIPSAYTHPNHSGEITSTGDGATVIADDVVDEANLKVSNTPTNGYVLTAQSGNTGGLTWAEASSGTITALNNQGAQRLTTIDATTTELNGEVNLTFDGSLLVLTGRQATSGSSEAQGYECPATITADWDIDSGNNAMFPGPMTIASGIEVVVPANRTLTIV